MPDIIVCYKWVADDQDVKVDAKSHNISISSAKYVINEYDKNAIEAAVNLKETYGGNVQAVSFGGKNLKNSLKDVLSRGVDSVAWIDSDIAETQDAFMAAQVLSSAIKHLEKADLIICGDGSSDLYSRQTAQRLAVLLDIPVIDNVESLHFENGKWIAERQLRDNIETVTFTGPAVLSVLPGIARPRIPGMKQILAAGKKPQIHMTLEELDLQKISSGCASLDISSASQNRKNIIFREASVGQAVARLVEALKADAVIQAL